MIKEDFLKLLKAKAPKAAIKMILPELTRDQRAAYVLDLLPASRFKSYRLAIETFTEKITTYFLTKNPKMLQPLRTSYEDPILEELTEIRNAVVNDLSKGDPIDTYFAIMLTCFPIDVYESLEEDEDHQPQFQQPMMKIAVDLACILWPDDVSLKILFGG